ncbi:thiamine diphosphokinase [Rhabdothermincola salaria]|uniref:thiamine diphosphokinase n=1 Tax=Rhabdothermincola salaria TaxID=2903142 RepID=UPI001E4B2EF0|nr:thiamine diphosphokinase [Rhabdothermincola salaria]
MTGGEAPDVDLVADMLADVPDDAPVVAADSGIEHALRLGLGIDHAVGDFDSVEAAVLAGVEAAGTHVQRHPVAKDATDLELALDAAVELGALRVVVLGGHGGRLDHFLGNALLLASPRYANLVIDGVMGDARVHVARPWVPTRFRGRPGDLVTLLPVNGPAEGVSTSGLGFPLDMETLVEGTTRGVSNEMTADEAEVRLTGGCLLVVRPGCDADPVPSRPLAGSSDSPGSPDPSGSTGPSASTDSTGSGDDPIDPSQPHNPAGRRP